MEGGGFYNRHSAMQAAGIAALAPVWERACQAVAVGPEPLVIADYGSSQGRNSMAPMRAAIDAVRGRTEPGKPVEIVHTDLPSNDFTSLFTALGEPGSYLEAGDGIFPSAIGRTYFEQLFPPGRVHLGWNSWTMQWLNGHSIPAPDHVFAGLSEVESVRRALNEAQAQDWARFLSLRSRELRAGGMLLSAFPGRADTTGWETLGGHLWGAILDTGRGGMLTEDEQARLTLPTSPRSLDQIQAPFGSSSTFEGLRLEHLEIVDVPDPDWPALERGGDAAAYATAKANMMRAWSAPTLTALLGEKTDRHAVVDEIYTRLAERVAASPRRHEPKLAITLLRKMG
jgi:hypothetical protein